MLRRGPPYASAALLGASLYVGLVAGLDVRRFVAQILAVILVLVIRGISRLRGWESPEPRDLTPVILRAGTWVRQGVDEGPVEGPSLEPPGGNGGERGSG
jgi:hypothetical protein